LIVFTKMRENSRYNDTIPFNKKNVTRHKLRYYYKAPNMHRYRFLSKPIGITELGEPNQATGEMDEEWEKRIGENYDAALLPEQTYRGRGCHVLNLVPKVDSRFAVPMTLYVDKKRLLVLKIVSLSENSMAGKLSTKGDLYYRKIEGRWLLSAAHWTQIPSTIPQKYEFKIYFGGHKINKKIGDSVFE
ncbi:MAG: outer membrane lipoprotein-sorting protein, partial [bacterium]